MVPAARQTILVDRALEEPDRTITEEHVHAAGVITPSGEGREGRAAIVLVDAGDVRVQRACPDGGFDRLGAVVNEGRVPQGIDS